MATSSEMLVHERLKEDPKLATVTVKGAKRKRAYHPKVKTGCLTCKIRRVRCDEEKPSCSRCASTGRKCDGYESPLSPPLPSSSTVLPVRSLSSTIQSPSEASSSLHLLVGPRKHNGFAFQATADLKLALPRTNPEELRSYRYFLEVTAPVIAGSFDAKFWLTDIPRVCLSDPAIWHAVVTLGSVHERYALSAGNSNLSRNLFALRQFNSSIRCLTEPNSPRRADRMRALTVSVIFTALCAMDGQYGEARMHARSGVQILKEMDEESRQKRSADVLKRHTMGPKAPNDLLRLDREEDSASDYNGDGGYRRSPWQVPISPAAVRSVIESYEVSEKTFANGGFENLLPLLTNNERFGVWSTYRLPSTSASGQSPLTTANLTHASRAAESLIHGLSKWAHDYSGGLTELCASPTVERMFELLSTQAPYIRCLRLLQRAVCIFEREMAAGQGIAKGAGETSILILERTLLAIQSYINMVRFVMVGDPNSSDVLARYRSLPVICTEIVDGAQQIFDIETKLKAQGVPMPPIPSLATPLFVVAFSGFSWPVRRRALTLLRAPRMDGLWDSLMAAGLAEATMEREKEAVEEGRARGLKVTMRPASLDDTEEETATLFRVYKMYVDFTGKREMRLRLRTWGEFINGEYGRDSIVYW